MNKSLNTILFSIALLAGAQGALATETDGAANTVDVLVTTKSDRGGSSDKAREIFEMIAAEIDG